jgi:hypothetical protein
MPIMLAGPAVRRSGAGGPRRAMGLRGFSAAATIAIAVGLATGAAAASAVSVVVTPAYAQTVVGQTVRFTATLAGSADAKVIWQVDNAAGGSRAAGTITLAGVYTAPAALPVPASATVTAVSAADPAASATATVTLLARRPAGRFYFVAPNGNDANPGTKKAPLRHIQTAAKLARAGDTVLVRQGVYRELVSPPFSGNATRGFITFESYPGETATIDGKGLPIPGGQSGLFTISDQRYLIVEGFELRNYSTNRLSEVPIGIYVEGAGSNIQVINNHVHDIATRAPTNPIQCGSNAFGITADGSRAPAAIDGLVVSGNEIDHLHTGCSETLSVDGNVEHFAITGNRIHDDDNIGIDAIGFEGVSPGPTFDQSRDGEIRGNTVYNISSFGNPDYGPQYSAGGIYIDGGARITIEQNLVHHVDLGIELASEQPGHVTSHVTARNNVIYADNSNGISIGGFDAGRGGTDHCMVVNNTLFGDDTKETGSGELQIQFHATNNLFANNIAYAEEARIINNFTTSTANPAVVDYDLYDSPVGVGKSVWQWDGVSYQGYAKYRAATGLDAHSPFTDPRFVSTGTPPDFRLMLGSPAEGAGTDLGAAVLGTVDFTGNPRVSGGKVDIGAYQLQPARRR